MVANGPTNAQLARIHILAKEIGWSEWDYRDAMYRICGVDTSTMMCDWQVARFIAYERRVLEQRRDRRLKPTGEEMATPAQRAKIIAMWAEVSYTPEGPEREKALNAWIRRRWKVERLEWVPQSYASKIIRALQAMRNQKQTKEAVHG